MEQVQQDVNNRTAGSHQRSFIVSTRLLADPLKWAPDLQEHAAKGSDTEGEKLSAEEMEALHERISAMQEAMDSRCWWQQRWYHGKPDFHKANQSIIREERKIHLFKETHSEERRQKRKRKQKRKGGRHLCRGAKRPSCRFPACIFFSFVAVLIRIRLISPSRAESP